MPERGRTLLFFKIGGSVLGDKRRVRSFRVRTVERIGREVSGFLDENPESRFLIGHGGGPMAHAPAAEYRTREGIPGGGGWEGYAATRLGVIETNLRVISALRRGGLNVSLVSPSAGCIARDGRAARWDIGVLRRLIDDGQVPLIHGDVVLDEKRGFTILGTEDLFAFLVPKLRPARIILASDVDGVMGTPSGKTSRATVIKVIDRSNLEDTLKGVRSGWLGHKRHDVTGGMKSKIIALADLARRYHTESRIISGLKKGRVRAALDGDSAGTLIK
jgi:isopentenyl phosphate kinase